MFFLLIRLNPLQLNFLLRNKQKRGKRQTNKINNKDTTFTWISSSVCVTIMTIVTFSRFVFIHFHIDFYPKFLVICVYVCVWVYLYVQKTSKSYQIEWWGYYVMRVLAQHRAASATGFLFISPVKTLWINFCLFLKKYVFSSTFVMHSRRTICRYIEFDIVYTWHTIQVCAYCIIHEPFGCCG